MINERRCSVCKAYFPATDEYFYKANKGLSSRCKKCSIEKAKKWNETHPERRKEILIKADCKTTRITKQRKKEDKVS